VDLLSRTQHQALSVKFCQMSGVRRNDDFFNRKHLIMMKNDQSNNFLLKTGDILNFRFFEETTILQELEPEKVRYLGISLTDFASKT
jgi:GDP-D-mannose dehydratase